MIFRKKFLKNSIPILKRNLDSLIRNSYFGGSSDYFYKYGENLKYYDINSLYPFALLNDMPLKFLGTHTGMKLEDTFGFIGAVITSPKNVVPLLLHQQEGKRIHPTAK